MERLFLLGALTCVNACQIYSAHVPGRLRTGKASEQVTPAPARQADASTTRDAQAGARIAPVPKSAVCSCRRAGSKSAACEAIWLGVVACFDIIGCLTEQVGQIGSS